MVADADVGGLDGTHVRDEHGGARQGERAGKPSITIYEAFISVWARDRLIDFASSCEIIEPGLDLRLAES